MSQTPRVPTAAVRLDRRIRTWMARRGPLLVRTALAVVFVWFGALKLFQASPADDLVRRTVYWFPPDVFIPVLGVWEVAIGLLMLGRSTARWGIFLMFLQMPGTFLPLLLLPEVCFVSVPFVPTMEGQYIIKNIVLIAAAILAGSRLAPMRSSEDSHSPGDTAEKDRIIAS